MRGPAWTIEQIQYLKDNYLVKSHKEMAEILGRSADSVKIKCKDLRLLKKDFEFWSEEKEKIIISLFGTMTYDKIAEKVNKSKGSVIHKLQRLGLIKEKDYSRNWQEKEIIFLKDNYNNMSSYELAKIIKTTPKHIAHKLEELGLERMEPKIGDIYYKLKILEINYPYADCVCECGEKHRCILNDIKNRRLKSCGCIIKIHGLSGNKIYNNWRAMIGRCYDPNNKDYHNYGAKGISVCDEWREDIRNFYNWAMSNGYRDNLTVNRKDNSKGYYPENCEWADLITQANNRSNNHLVTIFGETKTIMEWSRDKRAKVHYDLLKERINRGVDPEIALTVKNLKKEPCH